ncbi:MAG TPA: recombinase family protein [Pirellulaceae bacterium]|nr:recombinase family protein [Pirellulaceae bacterium]
MIGIPPGHIAVAKSITGSHCSGYRFFGLPQGESEMTKPRPRSAAPSIRCAIYTRKSTEESLDLDFNSLDAQRESGEAYIKNQANEGWVCLPDRYDDGGFTGGNMDRPALKRLLADIEAGKVDCVVVYKVDRISRSLLVCGGLTPTGTPTPSRPGLAGAGTPQGGAIPSFGMPLDRVRGVGHHNWAAGRRPSRSSRRVAVAGTKDGRRPDVICYLNGLPIAVVELKNPTDVKADVWAVYRQLQTYKDEIGDLS